MYKGYLVDKDLLAKDPHFRMGCRLCHKGDEKGQGKEAAHKGLVKRPSDNLRTCGACHRQIADNYSKSLHYTTAGQRNGIMPRFSPEELKIFDKKVFEQSCRSCHASCGDCHVKSPPIAGIGLGLFQRHKFVRKDEGKTCAFCHGGRVYPEYTGEYGGSPDVHYQKGMACMDCHKKAEFHGDGTAYATKQAVKDRPSCRNCHKLGEEAKLTARVSHERHKGKVSCYGCHTATAYRQCQDCHAGKGASARPAMILGLNPRDRKTLTTLRLIPTVRDTFLKAGIKMENFDSLPNYWDSPVHNIRKRTDRTRNCDACHVERARFLDVDNLIRGGSKENQRLMVMPPPIGK